MGKISHLAPEEATPLISEYCRLGGLRKDLERLLACDDHAKTLAQVSYDHANSFTKLVIAESKCGEFRARLHFWPPDEFREQNIHNHRFAFWSHVIRGTLTNHVWTTSSAKTNGMFFKYIYKPRLRREHYEMERQRSCGVKSHRSFDKRSGDTYYFDNITLHSISCSDSPITLLIEDRRHIRGDADVYCDKDRGAVLSMGSPSLKLDTYTALLRKARDVVATT